MDVEQLIANGVKGKELSAVELMIPAFQDAVVFAKQGNWQQEYECICAAHDAARSIASLRGSAWFVQARDKLIRAGLIFLDSDHIGDVAAENALNAANRKKSNLELFKPSSPPISIRTDRVLCARQVAKIDEFTSATVIAEGIDQITQRPTLTRMALLAPLPGSALLPGLALQKKERTDLREIVFYVGSSTWQFSVNISPNEIPAAKQIASRLNSIVAEITARKSSFAASEKAPGSSLDEVEKLADMHTRGLITNEEFQELKRRLLGLDK